MTVDMNDSLLRITNELRNEIELYDSIYGTGKTCIMVIRRSCVEASLIGGWRDIDVLLEKTFGLESESDNRHEVEYLYWLVADGNVLDDLGKCLYYSNVERSLGDLGLCELVIY